MKIQVFDTEAQLASHVASLLAAKLEESLTIGFATGKTMVSIYEHLKLNPPRTIKARATMLDEYLGLRANDERSYAAFLNHHVFSPLHFPNSQIFLPQDLSDPIKASLSYEKAIHNLGGLDLQLLGIGLNGHVGLNEPGSSKESRTRVVKIAESTRVANQNEFSSLEEVPTQALTLGMATLREAKNLWLIANGEKKSEIILKFLKGEVSEDVPATLLRDHPGLTVFLDKNAAKKIS
ncbi:MAG: glucosamine-6-phosphate deaminase [Bacteriovoracaceae bacterium]|nr:glucosamine-6-phosphate deaminase [Bacteriovoracaceae bacterium]